jgi:hypothetical protein
MGADLRQRCADGTAIGGVEADGKGVGELRRQRLRPGGVGAIA